MSESAEKRISRAAPFVFGALRVYFGVFLILGTLAVGGFVANVAGLAIGLLAAAAFLVISWQLFRVLYVA